MTFSILSFCSRRLFNSQSSGSLASAQLTGHDQTSKMSAVEVVDILIEYKTKVHDFTDAIVEFWPLPEKVMQRYQLEDAEQLNEWLDTLS